MNRRQSVFLRIAALEKALGKRIIVRPLCCDEPLFRGRLTVRATHIVLEYHEREPGFFWGYDILHELLDRFDQRRENVTLYDVDSSDAQTGEGAFPSCENGN